ncbi:MAG: precorrin-6y C5,15-methyltransferase (decarboxylating) subunit CbiE [Ruminococcus sp.]|nr:precorrin-6y C5,15-methyltransferase (decarboxylating) subunit CbiE [Ruminococcus sp.]
MKVYLIGTGMDGGRTLTSEAREAIDSSELLIGAERMLKPFADMDKRKVCAYLPQDICDILTRENCGAAAILLSGDTGFFSGAAKLRQALAEYDTETICGISSAAYLCAKAGISYENMKHISLHGRDGNIAVNVRMNEKCFFLLGGSVTAADVCRRLCEYGMPDVQIYIGERLGYADEKITAGIAAELCGNDTDKLCCLAAVNGAYLRHIPSCIGDESFVRGEIPMTKSAVRGNIVSGLDIEKGSVCWDIGCGTGSISVEMAFRCPDGRVYSFDKKAEAVRLTEENAKCFGCDNIFTYESELPDLPEEIPAPDKVFIGGGSGSIKEVFGLVRERNESADICVSAVSVETLGLAAAAFEEYGGHHTITQLAVTETRRAGGHTMFKAQNPIFIIRGKLK